MSSKTIVLLVLIIFAVIIALLAGTGVVDITGIYERVVKHNKPSTFPEIEIIEPPAHGYHNVYWNGKEYYTYIIFKTHNYLTYTPQPVTSFPLKGVPILVAKYQDKDGSYVYEMIVKTDKINPNGEYVKFGEYYATFYPQIVNISDTYGIKIISPEDGEQINLDNTSQLTVYVLNTGNDFIYNGDTVLLGGQTSQIISQSLLTADGEKQLTNGVTVSSGDVIKIIISLDGQTPGTKELTVNVNTQNHGTLTDSVNIELVSNTVPRGQPQLKITNIYLDDQPAQVQNGVYLIPVDQANNIVVETQYTGENITTNSINTELHSNIITIGINKLAIKHGRNYRIPFSSPMTLFKDNNVIKLTNDDLILLDLSKGDLENGADGQIHTLYVKVKNTKTGEWLQATAPVKIIKEKLSIKLIAPHNDETINLQNLKYGGLYLVKFNNTGERSIYMTGALVKFINLNNPQDYYYYQPIVNIEDYKEIEQNKIGSFYINFNNPVAHGVTSDKIHTGDYKVVLVVYDKYQVTPVSDYAQPVHIIVPDEAIKIVSPQPNALVDAKKQTFINAVVVNSGKDGFNIQDVKFIWIPIDKNGNIIQDEQPVTVVPNNYQDIVNTYTNKTFNPGDSFTATIQIPQINVPIKYYMLVAKVTDKNSNILQDSVAPIILFTQCDWQFNIQELVADSYITENGQQVPVWDYTQGVFKTITLVNSGNYPIKISSDSFQVILINKETGQSYSVPIMNLGSIVQTGGSTYWEPGKTIQLIISIVGVGSGDFDVKVIVKNHQFCAVDQIKSDVKQVNIKAPKQTCGNFLKITKPSSNSYINLGEFNTKYKKAGIFTITAKIDVYQLAQQTGKSQFKFNRIALILKDSSGNIVYTFQPYTEILNYQDIINSIYDENNQYMNIDIDAGGLIHTNLLDKPLTIEVSAYSSDLNCYDSDDVNNIYFIYPTSWVFDAVITSYNLPADSQTINQIQYDNGHPTYQTISIDTSQISSTTIKINAINDGDDYDKDGAKSTVPVVIKSVGTPVFYDPDHHMSYYASFCKGSSTNTGLLWTKLTTISWCIDFSTIPPTDIQGQNPVVPDGYILQIPVTVEEQSSQTTKTIYLQLPRIHIIAQHPPTSGFSPLIVAPVKENNKLPEFELNDNNLIVAIKRPAKETNDIVITSIVSVKLFNELTGETITLTPDQYTIYQQVIDNTQAPTTQEGWQNIKSQLSGNWLTLSQFLQEDAQYRTFKGGQDNYLVLSLDLSKVSGLIPSYYQLKVRIVGQDPSNTNLEYDREVSTEIKLKNSINGQPAIKFTYPNDGQTITLNLDNLFTQAFIMAGGNYYYENMETVLPALKDTLDRTRLSVNPEVVEIIYNLFKDWWARKNYRPALDINSQTINNMGNDIIDNWYWQLEGKNIEKTKFQDYEVFTMIENTQNTNFPAELYFGLYDVLSDNIIKNYQIFESAIMADESKNLTVFNTDNGYGKKGVIRLIVTDMSPDQTLTVKLVAIPEKVIQYVSSAEGRTAQEVLYSIIKNPDQDIFPVITFKLRIITSTKPSIEYPNNNQVEVTIGDFDRVYDWQQLIQIIGQPQKQIDDNLLTQLEKQAYYYSYGTDSYNHGTYVRIFNPAGVAVYVKVTPIYSAVNPIITQLFKDSNGMTFSLTPGIISRDKYDEWVTASEFRYKLPLELFYFAPSDVVKYKVELIDKNTGEVYDTKYLTVITYTATSLSNSFDMIQPQQYDHIDVYKLAQDTISFTPQQTAGSKVMAGDTVEKPLYFWTYIQFKKDIQVKDVKVYIDNNPVEEYGIRAYSQTTDPITYKPGMVFHPEMALGVKLKIGSFTYDTTAKKITNFKYDYSLGEHTLTVKVITGDDKTVTKTVTFKLYNSNGKVYYGKIIYPKIFTTITPAEYYNNNLIVKFDNLGTNFTVSTLKVFVNTEEVQVDPSQIKVLHYDEKTGTTSETTLNNNPTIHTNDLILIPIPSTKLTPNDANSIKIMIDTGEGGYLEDKTVFFLSDKHYSPLKMIKYLNVVTGKYYNTHYTDKLIILYTGAKDKYSKAEFKVDEAPIPVEPLKLIRNGQAQPLTKDTIIQNGDILIFQIKTPKAIPIGIHKFTFTLYAGKSQLTTIARPKVFNQDWGNIIELEITSPNVEDKILHNYPLIITAVNEKAPFKIESYTLKIDGQQVTPQKAKVYGENIEDIAQGTEVKNADTLYFEVDASTLQPGAHSIEIDLTTNTSQTITLKKNVFLFDPLTPTKIVTLNPVGDTPVLITALFALGGNLVLNQDTAEVILPYYPISFTWDRGESPMKNIVIVWNGEEHKLGAGITQIIIKTRDGQILNWNTNKDYNIHSGDVVTAYLVDVNDPTHFTIPVLKLDRTTNSYSIPIPNSLEIKVDGKTVKGSFNPNTGEVDLTTQETIKYRTVERIQYVTYKLIKYKVITKRFIEYVEDWYIYTPVKYTYISWHIPKPINMTGNFTDYCEEHPRDPQCRINWTDGGPIGPLCQPEYGECCAIKRGELSPSQFSLSDLTMIQFIGCICDQFMPFGGCGCCPEGKIIDNSTNSTGGGGGGGGVIGEKTACLGSIVTHIHRVTDYIITSEGTISSGGDTAIPNPAGSGVKQNAGAGSSATILGFAGGVELKVAGLPTIVTITDKETGKTMNIWVNGSVIYGNGLNPYTIVSYNAVEVTQDGIPNRPESVTERYNLHSALPAPPSGANVTINSYTTIESYFISQCKSGVDYKIRKVLDYTVTLLVPDGYELYREGIPYNDTEVIKTLEKKWVFNPNKGLPLLKFLPIMEYPSDRVPYWIYPEDFNVEHFMIPIQLTIYSVKPEQITGIHVYMDGQELPESAYLPVIIDYDNATLTTKVIPYNKWNKTISQITQMYILYIPDKLEVGKHKVTVVFDTVDYGQVGVKQVFNVKPAFPWSISIVSLPKIVYKNFGNTVPVYVRNSGMAFRYNGLEVYVDGNKLPDPTVYTVVNDTLKQIQKGDTVQYNSMLKFDLDISSLSVGKHNITVVVDTGMGIKVTFTKQITVENQMKYLDIAITSPKDHDLLLMDKDGYTNIYVENIGDSIKLSGVAVTVNGMLLPVESIEKVTTNGLEQVNINDTIDSQTVLKLKVKIPKDKILTFQGVTNTIVMVALHDGNTGKILKDSKYAILADINSISQYKISIATPTSTSQVVKGMPIQVIVKNDGQAFILDSADNIAVAIDGNVVTPNNVVIITKDGEVKQITEGTVVNTGDMIRFSLDSSNLDAGTHTLKVGMSVKTIGGSKTRVVAGSDFTVVAQVHQYMFRISSPRDGSAVVGGRNMNMALPVYLTVTGESMSIATMTVYLDNKQVTPENIKISNTNSIIDFTPGATAEHYSIISFYIPLEFKLATGLHTLTVKIITTDGITLYDRVMFGYLNQIDTDYFRILSPEDGATYLIHPLKTTSVEYYTPKIKYGDSEETFKRAQNRFLYGVKDTNTLIASFNQLIGLINQYHIGGFENLAIRQMIQSNPDKIRPYIQMIEWDADIENMNIALPPRTGVGCFKDILTFTIDKRKLDEVQYDPDIVMKFTILDKNVTSLGPIAFIFWKGQDGNQHSTALLLYKGLVIPEEIIPQDFILQKTSNNIYYRVVVPIFYGFDYSGKDKIYHIRVDIVNKKLGVVLDSKTFTLDISGKRFKQPVGFRLVYPMSIYSDYYKTSYTPITEWQSQDLPVMIEWYDYLYKFEPTKNNWFMGLNWIDKDGGHLLGIGRDNNGYYYRYDSKIAYTTESDISQYIEQIINGMIYNTENNQPAKGLIWLPSLQTFKTKLGLTDDEYNDLVNRITTESHTVQGSVGTDFVFIVYTATHVADGQVQEYNFADESQIVWGTREIDLRLEPIIKDSDNDGIPDYIIPIDKLQQAMQTPVWQNTEYFQNAQNYCGGNITMCMVNGYVLDKLAHKQVGFKLINYGSYIFKVNDLRKDLKFSLREIDTNTQYNNLPIFIIGAPTYIVPRSSAEVWVIIDNVPSGKYQITASLSTNAQKWDWLTQFQQVTGIQLTNGDTSTTVNTGTINIPVKGCGDSQEMCLYYNRMVELMIPSNGQEIPLEQYHNSIPFNFKLFLDGQYLLEKFTLTLYKESKGGSFVLRYFDPDGGVIRTEELIQQSIGNPQYIMTVILNQTNSNVEKYITKTIDSNGQVTETDQPTELVTISLPGNSQQPVVSDGDSVYGSLGVPNFPEQNIGLNTVSITVVLKSMSTGEEVVLKDANADVTIGRKVIPRDNKLKTASPTRDITNSQVPLQVVDTCVKALALTQEVDSNLQIYSKENKDQILKALGTDCNIPFTEDYTNKKLEFIDYLPVGEFKVMYKVYDPTCNCIYQLNPTAWEHLRHPVDSGISGTQTGGAQGGTQGQSGASIWGIASGNTTEETVATVVNSVPLNTDKDKTYTIVNAGGYAWYINQTTIKIGFGYTNGNIYLDNDQAVYQMAHYNAVWDRASWYIMFVKKPDGSGYIKIKYPKLNSYGYYYITIPVDNMADLLGINNNQLVPIQGSLSITLPSMKSLISKFSDNEQYGLVLTLIYKKLLTIDSTKLAFFTYTGTPQGEDYNEYSVNIERPDKILWVTNIADASTVYTDGYSMTVSITNLGNSPMNITSIEVDYYDSEFTTTPYIIKPNITNTILTPNAGNQETITLDLKRLYIHKTLKTGQAPEELTSTKIVVKATDSDGNTYEYTIFDPTIKFQLDNQIQVVYPATTTVDGLYTTTTSTLTVPIKLKVIYQEVNPETGETIYPTIHIDSITVTLTYQGTSKTFTKTLNKDYKYGDYITFWASFNGVPDTTLSGAIIKLSFNGISQVDKSLSGLTIYPSTGITLEDIPTTQYYTDVVFGTTQFNLKNQLHNQIIKETGTVSSAWQLKNYVIGYTITLEDGTQLLSFKYTSDNAIITFYGTDGSQTSYTLTYKTKPPVIDGMNPEDIITYTVYGLNYLNAQSKADYNNIINELVTTASRMKDHVPQIQYYGQFTFTTRTGGETKTITVNSLKTPLLLKDYDPIITYPTSNSLMYIPKAVDQFSMIMYNLGGKPLTIDLSTLSVALGNIGLEIKYVKDAQGNTITANNGELTGTITLSEIGGDNPYMIIRVSTKNVNDGLYNLNLNFDTTDNNNFYLQVQNLQIQKVDEMNIFEPEWNTITSEYTSQYGNDYITLPLTYPPETYGTIGDIQWKNSTDNTIYFLTSLQRIYPVVEPSATECTATPCLSGQELEGVLINSLKSHGDILSQGDTLGVMIDKSKTISVNGQSIPYSDFFKGINKLRLYYTNPNSEYNNMIVFTEYFLWDGNTVLWLHFKFNGWYFDNFNWRIPIEVDPNANITQTLVGYTIKIVLNTQGNEELQHSLEDLVDTDGDGVPDTPAWKTKQVGIRITWIAPNFDDINGDGQKETGEAEVPFYIENYDGTNAIIYIKVPIISPEYIGKRILNIYYYGAPYNG